MAVDWRPTPKDVEAWFRGSERESYFHRCLVLLDAAANTIAFSWLVGYSPWQTMSSHFGLARLAGSKFGATMSRFLALFQKHHVWAAMAGDSARDEESEAVENPPIGLKEGKGK